MSPVPGGRSTSEEVGLVPEDVGEELLERLVQHRAPPDDGLVLLGEEAHRDAAHAVGLRRDEHLVDDDRAGARRRACAGSRSPTRRRRRRRPMWPRWASATARLVVTDDLPTPPLPEAMSSTRVRADGSANGMARPSAWPWAWLGAGGGWPGRRGACSRSAARSSSVMTVKSRSTRSTPSSAATAPRDPVGDLGAQRAAGDGEGDRHGDRLAPSMATSLTMPRSTMLRCSSGSSTGRRASMTSASVTAMVWASRGRGDGCCSGARPSGISPTAIGRIPAWIGATLSPTEFSSAVTAITSAFGDPTRREIYLFAREHDEGVTAAEVAEHFDLHPNVARHHLDKLAAGGYLEVGRRPRAGTGAGRPSKRYRGHRPRRSARPAGPPRRRARHAARPGARRCCPRDQAEAMAEEVGVEYGRMHGRRPWATAADGQRSFRAALHAVADALTAHGFAAHAEKHDDELRIVSEHCPFGDAAIEHPVICAVDRGHGARACSARSTATTPPSHRGVAAQGRRRLRHRRRGLSPPPPLDGPPLPRPRVDLAAAARGASTALARRRSATAPPATPGASTTRG